MLKYNNRNLFPTSGLLVILYFLQYYRIIYIYGFSFNTTHYYNNIGQYFTNKKLTIHNYDDEKK